MGQGLKQRLAPGLVAPAEGAAQLGQGLTPLPLGLGVDQVRHRLGLGQIELAVLERPPGEFPRLRQPQAKSQERFGDGVDHRGPAMQVQFGRILACVAARSGRPKHQGLVHHAAIAVLQPPQPRLPRRRGRSGQRLDRRPNRRSGQAHHRDGGASGRCGQGEDGVGHQGPAICGGQPRPPPSP